jgi:hypothetical protein
MWETPGQSRQGFGVAARDPNWTFLMEAALFSTSGKPQKKQSQPPVAKAFPEYQSSGHDPNGLNWPSRIESEGLEQM